MGKTVVVVVQVQGAPMHRCSFELSTLPRLMYVGIINQTQFKLPRYISARVELSAHCTATKPKVPAKNKHCMAGVEPAVWQSRLASIPLGQSYLYKQGTPLRHIQASSAVREAFQSKSCCLKCASKWPPPCSKRCPQVNAGLDAK